MTTRARCRSLACRITLCALALSLAAGPALAEVADDAYIEGVVSDFNSSTVTLFSEGEIVKVPRNSIPPQQSIRTGYAVTSYVRARFVAEQVRKHKKKKKRKRKEE